MIMSRIGRILINVYDITIVLPLLVERMVISLRGSVSEKISDMKTGGAK